MIRRFALLVAFAALACAGPAAALADSTILVKFASTYGSGAKVAALGDDVTGTTVGGVKVVDPQPGESVADALARYRARPDVLYAEPNRVVHLLDPPPADDTCYSRSVGPPRDLRRRRLVGLSRHVLASPSGPRSGSSTPGVDATHPDLVANVAASGRDLPRRRLRLRHSDRHGGHGTHVSGIAAATTEQRRSESSGLAFASPLIAVRVFHDDGSGSAIAFDSDVANGIAWAAEHGAKVINLSRGGGYSLTECNAVELAINSYHAVVVAAAGNSSVATPTYPAACPGVVGVAATDASDLPATFSNYGSPDVFVSAPGVFILSTWPAAIDGDCPYFPFEPSGYATSTARRWLRLTSPRWRR